MKVTLIDYTGAGSNDPLYAARLLVYTKNTRLEQGEETRARVAQMEQRELLEQLSYVANTLRSSWEFCDYTFEISLVTRAFTHQLVRTRTGSYAQQAQRVVDMGNFSAEMPSTVAAKQETSEAWNELMEKIAMTYQYLQLHGIPNQDCRGTLPTNVHTNIIAKFNLRTLADIIGKRQNLRAQGEYAGVAQAMAEVVLSVHPWARPFLYPDRLSTPIIDGILKELLGDKSPVDSPRINGALKELDRLKGVWG